MTRLALLLPLGYALPAPYPAAGDDAAAADGTPASCTEAALDAAIVQLAVGVQAPGGAPGFACGADPHVIPISAQKFPGGQVTLDRTGLVGLEAQGLSRHFLIDVDGDDGRTEAPLRGLDLANGSAADHCGGAVHALAGVQLACHPDGRPRGQRRRLAAHRRRQRDRAGRQPPLPTGSGQLLCRADRATGQGRSQPHLPAARGQPRGRSPSLRQPGHSRCASAAARRRPQRRWRGAPATAASSSGTRSNVRGRCSATDSSPSRPPGNA